MHVAGVVLKMGKSRENTFLYFKQKTKKKVSFGYSLWSINTPEERKLYKYAKGKKVIHRGQ